MDVLTTWIAPQLQRCNWSKKNEGNRRIVNKWK